MEVKKEALSRALKLLVAAGCRYAVIDEAGNKHGDLEIAEKKALPLRRALRFERGAMSNHFMPLIKDMTAGQSVVVPYGSFGVDQKGKSALRGSLASYCSAAWGNKTYITHLNERGVEVLRVE
jgi:hypothetical protein